MTEIVQTKAQQVEVFRQELIKTGETPLVEAVY